MTNQKKVLEVSKFEIRYNRNSKGNKISMVALSEID